MGQCFYMGRTNKTMLQRLKARTITDDLTGCWNFQHNHVRGYGHLTLNYKILKTHRIAYELFNGPIPELEVVLNFKVKRLAITRVRNRMTFRDVK